MSRMMYFNKSFNKRDLWYTNFFNDIEYKKSLKKIYIDTNKEKEFDSFIKEYSKIRKKLYIFIFILCILIIFVIIK